MSRRPIPGPRGTQGPAGPAGSSRPLTGILYVDLLAPAGGNGSIGRPFRSVTDAVASVPASGAATIYLAYGDYSVEGLVSYEDKTLSIFGSQVLNQSGSVQTHGLILGPSTAGEFVELQLGNMNCRVTPQSDGVRIFAFQTYIEAIEDGHIPELYNCEGSPDTMRMGSEGSNLGNVVGYGMAFSSSIVTGGVSQYGGTCAAQELSNNGTPFSMWDGSLIEGAITSAHPLQFWACTFPQDGTGSAVVIDAPSVQTDLATYARGIMVGVTWPANTTIIDQAVQLQPFWVASGVGQNGAGDIAPAYGTNAPGDLFIMQANAVSGSGINDPLTPVGWTLQSSKISAAANVKEYVYTRDARSTGGESGTVALVVPGGNPVTQAIIHTFGNVAATSFIEDITTATVTGGGPTAVPGPTVTPNAAGRLACAFTSSNGAVPPSPTEFTGNTGGTWLERQVFFSGIGGTIDLQTAALSADTPAAGGAMSIGGTDATLIALALVGSS